MNEILLANVRFYFAQTVFMTSCHFNAYDRLNKKKVTNSKIVIYFSGVTILLLILQVIGLQSQYSKLLTIVAFVGLLLTGASLVFELMNKEDYSFLMSQHKIFAEKYKSLRDEYMSLIADIMDNSINVNTLKKKRDDLQKRYSTIGEHSPSTTSDDYKTAQQKLGLNGSQEEEFTWSDKEIDKFLPQKLRRIRE